MAEWYIYALGIFAGGLGLLLVYIILRKQNIIGGIPILSDIVDPILFGQEHSRMTLKDLSREPPVGEKKQVLDILNWHLKNVDDTYEDYEDIERFEIFTGDNARFFYEPKTGDYIATGLHANRVDKDGEAHGADSIKEVRAIEMYGNLNTGKYEIVRRAVYEDGSSQSTKGTAPKRLRK